MDCTAPPNVHAATIINRIPANKAASKGEINQLTNVHAIFSQLSDNASDDAESPARPAPINAPITVCVPLIGILKIAEARIMLNEERQVPIMIASCIELVWQIKIGNSL